MRFSRYGVGLAGVGGGGWGVEGGGWKVGAVKRGRRGGSAGEEEKDYEAGGQWSWGE